MVAVDQDYVEKVAACAMQSENCTPTNCRSASRLPSKTAVWAICNGLVNQSLPSQSSEGRGSLKIALSS